MLINIAHGHCDFLFVCLGFFLATLRGMSLHAAISCVCFLLNNFLSLKSDCCNAAWLRRSPGKRLVDFARVSGSAEIRAK